MGGALYWRLMAVVSVLCLHFWPMYSQNLTCHPGDLRALQDLLKGISSGIQGWSQDPSSNCCQWPGVLCNSTSSLRLPNGTSGSGRVVQLDLGSRRLKGNLLSAEHSFVNLDHLRLLNLSRNLLNDRVPDSLLALPNLQVIDLSYNDFSGPIPTSTDLPSVQFFDISQNSFTGRLPVGICINSTRVRFLNLSVNYFSGDIPPGFGNCSLLEDLCFSMNELSGGLPEDIFRLGRLAKLALLDNKLVGSLSTGIGNLSHAVELDFSLNRFSGNVPDVFWNMRRLKYLRGHSNRLNGSIPASLLNSGSLVFLNLRNNSLGSKITLNCTALTSLVSLDLGTNDFTGGLPENLPACRSLRNINLARNTFSGEIPATFSDFPSLSYLSLSRSGLTNMSSSLRTLQQCKNLAYLVVTWNFYDEILPADLTLSFPNLRVLIAANCQLRGSLPGWLTKSMNLQLLDLSWNRLSGPIPPWLGRFESLFYLDLSNNSLTGEIPKEITYLPSLVSRNISLEEPSPDFPIFMKRNVSLRGLKYSQVLSLPPSLDLGHNSLSGSIWPEFGNLKKLHILELKNNLLSGSIPGELSGMTSLEALDLSYNNLSGTLPSSLAKLNFLSRFSVAYNNLWGPIPTGGQFATFPNSSFEGTNLCGFHAPSSSCSSENGPNTSYVRSRRSNMNYKVIIRLTVGVAVGAALVFGLVVLIVMRRRSTIEVDPEKDEEGSSRRESQQLFVMFQSLESSHEKLLYDDILKATNNFEESNIIGCGGFGLVYKAILPDGRKLAIKKLSGDSGQMEREFQAEVETLSRAQHPHLVPLQGYCLDGDARLLIYSFMENGSLDYWLHEIPNGPSTLSWSIRLEIARGAARALAYLHQECEPRILHRDIKSSNILLDKDFKAHLADFGLARLICAYDTHVTTDLVGTLGYIPPEYGQSSVATYKGDVYSFGVVLVELVTGKRPMDVFKSKGSRNLIPEVVQMRRDGRKGEIVDHNIYGKQNDEEILRVLDIAFYCLKDSPKDRPSTELLVSWLENISSGC
ncbi:hypothetical protein SAY87_009739 [Trapa incisa]|uniref:non-specific serine/threonine protein kinase n=1 Tax=Trapa incisa TaxID=236973 RepID=A0AAN7JZ97_9MYRT|nr:hypothetical protein SAY87_009739 [Trapa incisa]